MATNRGTFDGDIQEIEFIKTFNKDKHNSNFSIFTNNINCNLDNVYMVRVTTNQFSRLSNKITKTRSDCYAIYSEDEQITNILQENDYYLNESNIQCIDYSIIERSGISVKMSDSDKYQILKTGPNSFNSLFGSYELGAGASLFCMKDNELVKNKELVVGWNTTLENMKNYFDCVNDTNDLISNKEICQQIKTFCNNKITEMIDNSLELQKKIFNGYPIYDEPYSAWYLFSHGKLEKLTYIPFTVTTGSGRSHGDYTIVLKPKKED